MERIEIRQNKKKVMLLLALIIIAMGVNAYSLLFTDKFTHNTFSQIFLYAALLFMGYSVYKFYRKFRKDEPVIVLTSSGIEINEGKRQFYYPWANVISWDIKEDDNNKYLLLNTTEGEKRIGISILEMPSEQLYLLLFEYKK